MTGPYLRKRVTNRHRRLQTAGQKTAEKSQTVRFLRDSFSVFRSLFEDFYTFSGTIGLIQNVMVNESQFSASGGNTPRLALVSKSCPRKSKGSAKNPLNLANCQSLAAIFNEIPKTKLSRQFIRELVEPDLCCKLLRMHTPYPAERLG